jgi:hypothetical protein
VLVNLTSNSDQHKVKNKLPTVLSIKQALVKDALYEIKVSSSVLAIVDDLKNEPFVKNVSPVLLNAGKKEFGALTGKVIIKLKSEN